jgi:hypothetical protein
VRKVRRPPGPRLLGRGEPARGLGTLLSVHGFTCSKEVSLPGGLGTLLSVYGFTCSKEVSPPGVSEPRHLSKCLGRGAERGQDQVCLSLGAMQLFKVRHTRPPFGALCSAGLCCRIVA